MKNTPDVTPRERLLSALLSEAVRVSLPHIGLDFDLCREVVGENALTKADYEAQTSHARIHAFAHKVDLWIHVASASDHCTISAPSWLSFEAQSYAYRSLSTPLITVQMQTIHDEGVGLGSLPRGCVADIG